ncbi:MAG: hypothetical protein NT005_12605 [Spirochaetes bacterium]|nr:hypothetical protein [Spirochaetota bacterium]
MRTLSWRRTAACLSLLCAVAAARASCSPASGLAVPENAEARMALKEAIFGSVRAAAAQPRRVIEQPASRSKVAFEADVQEGALYLVFANQAGAGFPIAGAGTFIIKRSMRDGSLLQAKVFLQPDPGCFLRISPLDGGARTSMSLYLFGEPFQRDIVVPARFEGLLTAPVSRLMQLTSTAVDWPLALPPARSPADQRIARVVAALRSRLARLRDVEDGAMSRDGTFVLIADGSPQRGAASKGPKGGFNCSGFAKWVVDGFIRPLTGSLTDIAWLSERDTSSRGNRWSAPREEERDPYFGLDWTRNLARALEQARTGELPGPEAMDVRDVELFPYVEDVGYPVENLPTILYLLARRDPGAIYLGSVNSSPEAGAASGGIRQHHHVVVLFPYVEEPGVFRQVVMERNLETSLESMRQRYAGSFVHLVRLDSAGEFAPPAVE